ncbi:pirin family protein [Gluconacetobacter diazotrophicus]|uniref:Pirin family protein n=1 Tax=Gluconacetobacter diazotrophicus TaxID=33996 RepID=A0A7W4I3P2_GLUDI|nr:pirin family protein [Gluconacetobacter diazotrophicus]MBB2154981.1 pirin family protein [Gluconacetobacter diazotrophicus]
MMKTILGRYSTPDGHWVGDGFPVRSLFSYNTLGQEVSPFLLLDYAGPHRFAPADAPRGVGVHPHRGFETVTIVYDGEVEHRDSTGAGGVIGPGDVQWMTAGSGILHQEFHSRAYTRTGGPFRMVQLWVNLPARDKMARPGYQSIASADIPVVALPDEAGQVRVIAGAYGGTAGPARTFTLLDVWDVGLRAGAHVTFDLPEGHTAMLVVLEGQVTVNDGFAAAGADMVLLDRTGQSVSVAARDDAMLLVLTGQPIDEPIVGRGPFVMNTEAEIHQAIEDLRGGRFGTLGAA